MLIQIESGDAKSKRKVEVTEDCKTLAKFTAENLADAHKKIKLGRTEGWDKIK